jgi:hypothetical protein
MRIIPGATRALLCGGLLVALEACVHAPRLEPAAELAEAPGPGAGALVTVAGVAVEVRAHAWASRPLDLEDEVTPLFVRIANGSERPLRIRYEEFVLDGEGDQSWVALPPYSVEGKVETAVAAEKRPSSGFYVAPHAARTYPGLPPYSGPFPHDPLYYGRYPWSAQRTVELPTREMLVAALPEGVVEPGATVDGFLYFQKLPAGIPGVTFEFDLVDAATGASFGTIRLPFAAAD